MLDWLKPKDALGEGETRAGLRSLMVEGVAVQVMVSLTTGAFLVAFALAMGASNKVIGLLAAIGPLAQVMQIPSILLVEKVRRRKLIGLATAVPGRAMWLAVALIPFFVPPEARVGMLLAALAVRFALVNVAGCAVNSWVRDVVPEAQVGGYFARRMARSVAIGAALSLAAGFGIDFWDARVGDVLHGYSVLFAAGAAAGLVGAAFLARTPEPRMAPPAGDGFLRVLSEPFRSDSFRTLLYFLGSWSFAVNLAAPFFTVYLLKRLGLDMKWVLGLAVLSQLVHVLFLKLWGRLADRFTAKSVLAASGPLFLVSILVWPFTTMPEVYVLTVPLLVGIHVLSGMSSAGVNLASSSIALKAAPKGRATAYLATNAMVSGLAATVAPILAGLAADWFANKALTIPLQWRAGEQLYDLPAVSLSGLDFLFVGAFVLGLYSLQRLAAVREEGEVEERIVRAELFSEVRRSVRQVSTAAGLRYLVGFPFTMVREAVDASASVLHGSRPSPPAPELPSEGAGPERPPGEEPPSPPDPGTP
jgi:MFS family permease